MNYLFITLLLLAISTSRLYSQEQKNINQQTTPKSTVLRKAILESEKTGQEYIINYPSGFKKHIVDKFSERDDIQLKQLQKRGLKAEYDTLYSVLLSGVIKKDASTQTLFNKILPDITQTNYSYDPEYCRQIAWNITSIGYTLPLLDEFQQRGINVVNYFSHFYRNNPWQYLTIFSPLIVVGRIDSAYLDTLLRDNQTISYKVSVQEVLKGDTTIKKLTIREYFLKTPSFRAETGGEYILFLFKNRYEYDSIQSKEKVDKQECLDCYIAAQQNILLIYGTKRLNDKQVEEDEKLVRNFCKEYSPIFKKIRH